MKTNLHIKDLAIVCTLGSSFQEIEQNLKRKTTREFFEISPTIKLPISKITNINIDDNIPRACLFAEKAISQIWESIEPDHLNNEKILLLVGCTKGDGNTISQYFTQEDNYAATNIATSSNAVNVYLSKKFKIPFIPASSAACATGAQLLIKAQSLLLTGECESILLCMTEASLTKEMLSAFYQLGVLTTQECGTAPFQKEANGFHMGEGAVAFYLKKANSATNHICGLGVATDAKHFLTFPNGPNTVLQTISTTCQQIGVTLQQISHVHLHGTATKVNDTMELALAHQLLQQNPNLTFSTFKQIIGHLLGASGLTEFALTYLCLSHQFLLPMHDFSEQFSKIKLAKKEPMSLSTEKYFLSLSYGLGSTIGIIVGNYQPTTSNLYKDS